MAEYTILCLRDCPDKMEGMAQWFHAKWNIPLEAYQISMTQCLKGQTIPQWYGAFAGERMIGGLGVIANDFHRRPDLTPNVCAVYVEKDWRGRGIAGELLRFACRDMASRGIRRLYLATDHTGFYERYGWRLWGMVQELEGESFSRMYVHEEAE